MSTPEGMWGSWVGHRWKVEEEDRQALQQLPPVPAGCSTSTHTVLGFPTSIWHTGGAQEILVNMPPGNTYL